MRRRSAPELPLVAESSAVLYKLDKNELDFGLQTYDRVAEKELFLSNKGKVPFAFSVEKPALSRTEVLPASGNVKEGGTAKIIVRVLPGLPQPMTETFHLQVAHFPPEEVTVTLRALQDNSIEKVDLRGNNQLHQLVAYEKAETLEEMALENPQHLFMLNK